MQLIPLSEAIKTKVDLAAVPGAISIPFLLSFPWAEAAGFLATVYGALRLIEYGVSRGTKVLEWVKARKSAKAGSPRVD